MTLKVRVVIGKKTISTDVIVENNENDIHVELDLTEFTEQETEVVVEETIEKSVVSPVKVNLWDVNNMNTYEPVKEKDSAKYKKKQLEAKRAYNDTPEGRAEIRKKTLAKMGIEQTVAEKIDNEMEEDELTRMLGGTGFEEYDRE